MRANAAPSSGRELRSARTRARLIEAAVEVIGAVGYQAASTRALVKAAKVNLSAIPYHFGGKKELYLAAAQMIAEYARDRFGEVAALLDMPAADDGTARFEAALVRLLRLILEDAEPQSWTSFVARCAYDNDEAFALIHEQAIAPLLGRLIRAAPQSRRAPEDEDLRLRITAIVTAIVSFRFLRGIVLRGMDWDVIKDGGVRQIEDMIRDLSRGNFLKASSSS